MLNAAIHPAPLAPSSERQAPSLRTFTLRFGLGALALILLFELVRGTSVEQRVFAMAVLEPAALFATSLDPAHPTSVSQRRLVSERAALSVTRGCEGTEALSLFAAAVLAFPATWRRRWVALGTGVLLIYVLSIFRLGLLQWVLAEHRGLFDAIHGVIAPLAPLVIVGCHFAAWAGRMRAPQLT